MNPGVLFLPIFRASTTAYLLGLAVLAVLDLVRLQTSIPVFSGALGMLAIWFFVFSIHANRLRYTGRGLGLAFLPAILAIIAKGIGAVVGFIPGIYQNMVDYAAQNGVDVEDEEALARALQDPGFQQSWQDSLTGDEAVMEVIISASATPSFLGYWVVIGLFAIWFATMRKIGGALDAAPAAASPLYPEPAATPPAAQDTPEEAPATPDESPAETPEEAPETAPSEAPAETPSEVPSEAPSEVPDGPADGGSDSGGDDSTKS